MPVVQISMFTGRDEATKARLSREIACVVSEVTGNSIDDVHVIINEVDRDNWGRGLVLGSQREPDTSRTLRRNDYATVSRIVYDPETEPEYLRLRRDVINPGMATQSGFIDSLLLRPEGKQDEYMLVNRWTSKEEEEAYSGGPVHDALKEQALRILPRPLESWGAEVVHLDPDGAGA